MIVQGFGAASRKSKSITVDITSEGLSVSFAPGTTRNLRAQYFDLRDVSRSHAYLRTAITSIGRAIIGPGFNIVKHPLYGDQATDEQRLRLWDFYNNIALLEQDVRDISIRHPLSSRLYRTVGCLRLFGSAFWEIRRNKIGVPIGASIIDGYVHPNTDDKGVFKSPAYYQYKSDATSDKVPLEYEDVVPFLWPDFSGPAFASDVESLVDFTLASDVYMLVTIRELFKNMRTPLGIWTVDKDADPEVYETFVKQIETLYQGAQNYGKSAITSMGDVSYRPIAQDMKDAPWQLGRRMNRDETMSVAGQFPQKIGLEEVQGNALQELRREFWEQTELPITRIMTEIMWQEIHVRLFGIRGWMPQFNPPDFTTALQDASIAARYIQWGVWSPNDARHEIALDPVDGLDYHLMPTNMKPVGEQGGAEEPVDASDEEPTPLEENPIPGGNEPPERPDDGHQQMVDELSEYRRYLLNDLKRGKRRNRSFVAVRLPQKLVNAVEETLDDLGFTKEVVNATLDSVLEMI